MKPDSYDYGFIVGMAIMIVLGTLLGGIDVAIPAGVLGTYIVVRFIQERFL